LNQFIPNQIGFTPSKTRLSFYVVVNIIIDAVHIKIEADRRRRHDGGNGVLINDLLFFIGFNHDDDAVEASDESLELKPINQKYRDGYAVPAGLVQEGILQVDVISHAAPPAENIKQYKI
jgi:hypothetical protein